MEISTAPPIEPAMMERRGLGLSVVADDFCCVAGDCVDIRDEVVEDILRKL